MFPKVISSGVRHSNLPESDSRQCPSEVLDCEDDQVIDLGCNDRPSLVRQTDYDLENCLFQGGRMEAAESSHKKACDILKMGVENRKLYSDKKKLRLSASFNLNKEKLHNWRDHLHYPLDKYVSEWPSNPPKFMEIVRNRFKEFKELGFRSLQELIAVPWQHMTVNFYPPCPEPELTYGLPGHTDPNALTILLQDLQVSGLQVLKDGTQNIIFYLKKLEEFLFLKYEELEEVTISYWHVSRNIFEMLRQGIFRCFGPSSDDQVLEYWNTNLEELDQMLFLKYKQLEEIIISYLKKSVDFVRCPLPTKEEIRGVILELLNE